MAVPKPRLFFFFFSHLTGVLGITVLLHDPILAQLMLLGGWEHICLEGDSGVKWRSSLVFSMTASITGPVAAKER